MSTATLSIIILLVCVVLFVTEVIPLVTTAVLGATAMVVFKVCTFSEGYGGFASETVFMIVGVIVLGSAMFETGAAKLLGQSILRIAGSNERVILGVSMTIAAAISAFISNTATVAMFIAILGGLVASNKNIKVKNMLMPIGLAAIAGGTCTLVGSTPQLIAQGILAQQLGKGFSIFDFTPIGLPIVLVMIVFALFVAYPMGKKIWGDRYDEGVNIATQDTKTDDKPINMTKVYIVLCVFALTIMGFITGTFGVGTTAMMAGLACVITGCISQKRVFETMDWISVGVIGGALGIAQGLAVSGGGKMIADAFINLVGHDASPFIIFAAIIFICMVLTQFMSNTATVAMLVPIALFICQDMGYNPYCFAMGLIFAANMSFSTPVATTPLTMTLVGGYKFMDYVKIGGTFNIICYFLVIALVPFFQPLVI